MGKKLFIEKIKNSMVNWWGSSDPFGYSRINCWYMG
jgi:hypothetical protein